MRHVCCRSHAGGNATAVGERCAGSVCTPSGSLIELSSRPIHIQRFRNLVSQQRITQSNRLMDNVRGLVGPRRMFGSDSPYRMMLWGLLVGACLPVITFCLKKRVKWRFFHNIDLPVMLAGASAIPQANGINYTSWFLAGFVFRGSSYPLTTWIADKGRARICTETMAL